MKEIKYMHGTEVTMKRFVTPENMNGEAVKRIRKQLGLTQKEFAGLVNT